MNPAYELDVVGIANFSENVYISGNVGIGTNTPNAVLHAYGSTPSGTVFNVEGSNGSLFSVVDNLIGTLMSINTIAGLPIFQVNSDYSIVGGRFNQNDFVVSSIGNVGIGTASPSHKLQVEGTFRVNDTASFKEEVEFLDTIQAGSLGTDTDDTVLILNGSNYIKTRDIDSRVWESSLVDGSGTVNYVSKWSDANTLANSLIFDNGTNVGIGNNAPVSKLDVSGVITANGGDSDDWNHAYDWVTQSGGLAYATGTGLVGHVAVWSSLYGLSYDSGNFYWDFTNNRLGIGTSTNPSYTLDVAGTGNFTGDILVGGDANITGDVIVGGNVTVQGTTVTANVDTMEVEDPILTLGLASGNIVTNTNLDRGIALALNNSTMAFMGWDTDQGKFALLSSGVASNSSGNYAPGTY